MSFAGLIQSTFRAVMLPSAAPWFILVVALPAVPAQPAGLVQTSDFPNTELSDFRAPLNRGWLADFHLRKEALKELHWMIIVIAQSKMMSMMKRICSAKYCG